MSQWHKNAGWHGQRVRFDRDHWRQQLALNGGLPCSLCGQPVTTSTPWWIEHLVPLAMGGTIDRTNQGVAHIGCQRNQGGRLRHAGHARRRAW